MMLRVTLLLSLFALSSAVDLKSSVIVTSADVPVDQPLQLSALIPDKLYRVYATFASGANDDYAKNVFIYDNTGARLTVAGLAQPTPNSVYILDDKRFLRAPIWVHDSNKGAASRVPFTVYVVDEGATPFPVVSARLAPINGEVDSNNGFIGAGITVLSAEPYFTMYNFDIGNLASMYISSVGYDDGSSAYNVMYLDSPQRAWLSSLSVYGPIATIFNSNWGLNARFKFQFTRNTIFDMNLSPGAAFALMSPGYLSNTQSYNIPYKDEVKSALDRSYTFNAWNYINVYYSVQDFQGQEKLVFRFNKDQNPTDITLQSSTATSTGLYANQVSVSVQNQNGDHFPRFLFQVTSGSSLSFSLLGLLIASLFSRLY